MHDAYRLERPAAAQGARDTDTLAVRVSAYYSDGEGGFVNGDWLTLPVPDR